LAAALPTVALKAQGLKIAIVNAQKSVADTQEIKKAQADLGVKYRPRQQDIEKLQNELQQIQSQLKAPNITPDKQSQLNSDGTLKQKQLQRLGEDLQQDFNQDRSDILGRAGQRMQDIIKKLAQEKGLDVVIDVSNALYYKPALDMTADATAAYDKAYPVTGSK
jgi:outer membrane protein